MSDAARPPSVAASNQGGGDLASAPRRAFTARSLLLGLAGGGGIVLLAGFNDEILDQSLLIGNHFPVGAYFYLLTLAAVWNPLAWWLERRGGAWGRCGRRLALSPPELAVVAAIALVACWAPTSGLSRYFTRLVVMPVTRYAVNPAWERVGEYIPDRLFPEGRHGWKLDADAATRDTYDRVYRDFSQGVASDAALKNAIGPFDWPWRAWLSTMAYWGPLIGFFALAGLAMAFIVHGQWSRREQLAYPLATIAGALVEREPSRAMPTLFRSKMFWGAMGGVAFIHGLRWLSVWHPDVVPEPVIAWDIPWRTLWPSVGKAGWFREGMGAVYFCIIGITYFLSSEIGFTLGISQLALAALATQYYLAAGKPLAGQDLTMSMLGAYLAYAVMFLWTGRAWYRDAFAYAVRWSWSGLDEDRKTAAAATRMLGVGLAGFWGVLVLGGEVDWLAAGVFTVFLHVVMLVFMRLICETGMPFLNVHELHVALARLVGYSAVGPQAIATLNLTHEAIWRDPRECLPPYAATASEVGAKNGVALRRLMGVLALVAVLSAGASWWVRNWGDYNWGASSAKDPMAHTTAPRAVMNVAATAVGELRNTNALDEAAGTFGLAKLGLWKAEKGTLPWFWAGAVGVLLITLARYRWRAWPLHPALLLVWNTWPMQMMSHCFLIGWAVKCVVMRFGGGRVYLQLKPLFLGLIVGDILMGGVFILFGLAYYAVTGQPPMRYLILPQ